MRSQCFCRVVRSDWNFLLQQDFAGVEAGIDAHAGHAGDRLARCNRPLEGRRTTVLRQKRRVQVDVAQRRQVNHPLGNDAPIAHDDDSVRLQLSELISELFIVPDFVGLKDWQGQIQRTFLDRGRSQLKPAPARPVRLRDDEVDRESGFHQLFQRGDSEARWVSDRRWRNAGGLRCAQDNSSR